MDKYRKLVTYLVAVAFAWNNCVTSTKDSHSSDITSICPTGNPYGCTCHEGQNVTTMNNPFMTIYAELNCTNTQLDAIPDDLPKAVITRFSGNRILDLKTIPDNYRGVYTLHLVNNGIRMIEDRAFKNLKNLTNLFINYEKIAELHMETFAGLGNVSFMDLSDNALLRVLVKGVFGHRVLPKLGEIKLSNCNIYEIETDTFANASELVYIGLANNKLKNLPVLSEHSPLLHLHTLRLGNNSVAAIRNVHLRNMPALQTVSLTHNELTHVANGAFDAIASTVNFIDLSYNHITEIEPTAFTKLTSLTELNLDHNKLKHVLWEELPWTFQLTRISLSGNEWSCDCRNAYLVEGHERIDTYHKDLKLLRCASPEELAGTSIYEVSSTHFFCDNRPHRHIKKALLTTLYVLIGLLLLGVGVVVGRRMVSQRKAKRSRSYGVYTKFYNKGAGVQYVDQFTI